jgi:hypothetical protein
MASFPQVGAQAVILGMSAFNANAKTVNAQMAAMGRSAFLLERTTVGAMRGMSHSTNMMVSSVAAGSAVAIAALLAIGTAAVSMGNKYAVNMAFMGAISESTAAQMRSLNESQLELSRTSTTSALGVQAAASELVKAGFSIEEVTGSTLRAVNNLVVASNGELEAANAALIAQVAVASFGTTAENAANVASASLVALAHR